MVIVNVSGSRFSCNHGSAPPLVIIIAVIRPSDPRVSTPASRRRRRNHGDGGHHQHRHHVMERDLFNNINSISTQSIS
jgi:hypothetical protein